MAFKKRKEPPMAGEPVEAKAAVAEEAIAVIEQAAELLEAAAAQPELRLLKRLQKGTSYARSKAFDVQKLLIQAADSGQDSCTLIDLTAEQKDWLISERLTLLPSLAPNATVVSWAFP